MQSFIRDYSLPRTDDEALEFRGELIFSQDFVMEEDMYLDSKGQVQVLKHKDIMTFSFYRTDDDRFVYHAIDRMIPPVKPEYASGKFETLKQHRKALKQMELLRQKGPFKPGPMRFATS